MVDTILFSTDPQGTGAARLPYELKKSGFRIWIFCPDTSVLQSSIHINGGKLYKIHTNITRIAETMSDLARDSKATTIFPCDDFACTVLRIIAGWPRKASKLHALQRLIRRWIGTAIGLHQRSKSLEDVQRLDVPTPRQIIIDQKMMKPAELEPLGLPILIKSDNSSGGMGVSLASSTDDAIRIAIDMAANNSKQPISGKIVAQRFISGRSASVSFSAYKGKMLEAFSYTIAMRSPEPFGASCVINIEHVPDLITTAQRIIKMYSYTGFGGIDFIIPDEGGKPIFLEFNARQTRTTHLGGLVGADLCTAMAASLTGNGYTPTHGRGTTKAVTLFPFEWQRDPHSPYLHQGHHDVPWHDPKIAEALLAACPPDMMAARPFQRG